jgi:hypothetical protein
MAQLVLVALAALAAVAGFREAAHFGRDRGRSFMGVPPQGWAIACGVVGLIGAVFVPAIVLGALSALVGFNESRELEAQWREPPFGIAVPGWVVGCALFGFGGAVLTSTALWLVVCAFLAVVGEMLLAIEERNILADEKRVLLAENCRLLGNKNAKPARDEARLPPKTSGVQQPGVAGPHGTRQVWDQSATRWRESAPRYSATEPDGSAWSRQRRSRPTGSS